MMKRLICLAVVLCLVLAGVPLAFAQTEGQCGDEVTWSLSPEGTLTVSGTGEMWDFKSGKSILADKASVTAVVIESGVTRIGEEAFLKYENLRTLSIGQDVTVIGRNAFAGCAGLEALVIPENVTRIEATAFKMCTSLESLEIQNGDISLGARAFSLCSALTAVEIAPGSPTLDSQNPFAETPYLKSNTDSRGFHVLGDYLLYYGGTEPEPVIPASVRVIGGEAFRDTETLERIVIPEGVEEIGEMAFLYCKNLREVVVAKGVKSVGNMAFSQEVSLEKITFYGDFPSFHKNAFLQTGGTAYMPSGNNTWPALLDCYGGSISWGSFFSTTGCPHKETLIQTETTATCTEGGLAGREICRKCGAVAKEAEAVPALGHDWQNQTCSRCGEEKPAGMAGDVDGNETLNYQDALMILRYTIGLQTLEREDLADFDGNGRVDYNDALKILRASIGLK